MYLQRLVFSVNATCKIPTLRLRHFFATRLLDITPHRYLIVSLRRAGSYSVMRYPISSFCFQLSPIRESEPQLSIETPDMNRTTIPFTVYYHRVYQDIRSLMTHKMIGACMYFLTSRETYTLNQTPSHK